MKTRTCRMTFWLLGSFMFLDAANAAHDWLPTAFLPAPEANQAAAADETSVFAIANTHIAKYDRVSGQRIAVSVGEAKHLNSGFLRQGKLYCAHSNYPQTPERSEIKVLDIQTMQLSTFKDFGNFGGSLTWVIHHDGSWWCNFARYGADNGQTFLARFDEQWIETGRWKYPQEVIGNLGRYSISGGLWRDGHLVVTGHDDPVLFQLALPREGSVLRFVDKQRVPFTGQGIAADPKTGGLVGIQRDKRQVVFASHEESKAASLPSASSQGPWKRHVIDAGSRGADGVRLADVNGDGLPDIATGWEQGGAVRLCLNPGPQFAKDKWPAVTVGQVPAVEDAVCIDLDNDGALDVVSCAEGKSRVVSVHWSPGRDRILTAPDWRTEALPASANTMMWMFTLPMQVDGKHGIDLIAGGKNADAAIGWFKAPANARSLADWKWHPLRPVGWLMSIVASDMDSDGDLDIVFTDRKGQRSGAFWLENPGAGAAQTQVWAEHRIGGIGKQAMFLQLADLDSDGLEDVLLAVQPKEIHWLRRMDRSGKAWQSYVIPLPEPTGIAKAVSAGDIDGDGRLDLVFSCEQAKAPAHGLMWLSSDGQPTAGKWRSHALSGVDGVKHDLVALIDLDGDHDLDVITTEEVMNLGVIWYENPLR